MSSSIGRRIAFAVSASWLAQAARVGLNLIGLPIMFRYLSPEELGIWLILGQSSVVVAMLMDAGLTPTLARRIAFAAGRSRAGPGQPLDEAARGELADLLRSGTITYRSLSVGVFFVTFALGSLYLSQLRLHDLSQTTVWTAWLLMSLGHATTMWSGLLVALTTGLGYIAMVSIIGAVLGIGLLAVQIVVLLAGGGILSLAVVSVTSGIAYRLVLRWYLQRRQPQLFSAVGKWDRAALRSMAGPAVRSWLTAAGTVALFKTDQYFIALYVDPREVPAYYAAYTLLHNLALLALALGQNSSVFVSQIWHTGPLGAIHEIVLRSQRITLILMAGGVATLLVSGGDLISVWLGPSHFVGYPVLTVLCVMFLLCAQQNSLLAFSRATENEVYATSFLIAGGLNLVLAWVLVQHIQLLGVALATLVAQLLTTNWVVLVDGLRRLKLPLMVYVRACAGPPLVVFTATFFAILLITRNPFLAPTALDRSLAALAIGGCICLAGLWLFGLNPEEKRQVAGKVRGVVMRRSGLTGSPP